MSPPTRWVGGRLEVHDTVDSTNLIAERLGADGAPDGTLVLADSQTAGRGRAGRSFFSPPGTGLYLSLLLRPGGPPEHLPRRVFAAAAAVAETAKANLPDSVEVSIKWPNDVLLGGRKTAGINLPAHIDSSGVRFCVLGIGINVNTPAEAFPPELRELATSLRVAGGAELDRTALAEELLGRLESGLDELRAGRFKPVLDRWQKFLRMGGAAVRVDGPGVARPIEGIVEGIDEDGALLVRTNAAGGAGGAVERILAGDVHLVDSPSISLDSNEGSAHTGRG